MKRYFTILITWTLCPTTAIAADAIWTQLPPLPTSIANNAVTSRDNGDGTCTLYSFMGIEVPTNRNTITAASFKMTTPGGTWTAIADAPLLNGLAKIAANAITVAGEVYLIGGYTAGGPEVTEHRLFRYDPTADTYIQLADVPVEVDDTVVGVYQQRYIYLVSGWHGPINSNVRNVQVYDTQSDTWQQATQIPAPSSGLFGHAGTIIGDRIIYIDGVKIQGGFRISDTVAVGRIDPFNNGNITTVAWTVLTPHPGLPTYRAAASDGPTTDGLMLVTGGTDNPYNFNGTGYNGQPSFPLDQILTYDPLNDTWRSITAVGAHLPTMDHRGLIPAGDCWVTIGGMTAPGVATNKVYRLHYAAGQPLGDFNNDNTADLVDFEILLNCTTGPGGGVPKGCQPADLDCDSDIDFHDAGAFQLAITK